MKLARSGAEYAPLGDIARDLLSVVFHAGVQHLQAPKFLEHYQAGA